jgi:excisionase family DNA binding protein
MDSQGKEGAMNIRIEISIEQGESKLKKEYVMPLEDDSPKKSKEVDGVASDKRYVDIKFLVTYTGFKTPTIRDWIRSKRIPFLKVGKLIRFDLHQIDEWLKEKNKKERN